MKKIKLNVKQLIGVLGGAFLMAMPMGFVSCSEEIDESNFAIKSEMTAADFIDSDEQFSMIKTVFLNVRLGASENASPIYSVLTARGNYTIFLPTNEAVKQFYESEGLVSLEELISNPELSSLVAKSCIIDHESDNAYETADFPTTGSFDKPNLNDRLLTCEEVIVNDRPEHKINGTSLVIDPDNEVSNGFVHVVSTVVAPSALTLDKLLASADNMKVFSYLMQKTTWADSLFENLDVSYEDPDRPITYNLNNVAPFTYAQHRYIGYTALVEPDSVYAANLGVDVELDAEGNLTNGEAFVNALLPKAVAVYGDAEADNFTHGDNALNRFVAYHLIDGKMAYNKLVHHYNEFNYQNGDPKNPQLVNMPTNVWDFYTTMGTHPSLLKITQIGDASMVEPDKMNHPIYVNRISEYANGPEEDYKEKGFVSGYKGFLLSATNGDNDNNGLNGYYYPIDNLLFYTDDLRKEIMKRRVRFDATTMLPELLSNSVRGGVYTRFENGYFDNITREAPDTKLLYLQAFSNASWNDYQGDEFMVSGLYDFTLKLPPVPMDGTYEIRMGVAHNSLRGMCQIYFGDDPDRLMPAGLPYDMRQSPGPDNPAIPWIEDGDDWIVNGENDKNLRNQGYMKAPQYHTVCNGKGDTPVRQRGGQFGCVRRIITVADMKANVPYYLRFKTALKKTDSQFFMDYFEYAHTSVYNGPVAEDIW